MCCFSINCDTYGFIVEAAIKLVTKVDMKRVSSIIILNRIGYTLHTRRSQYQPHIHAHAHAFIVINSFQCSPFINKKG